MPRNVKLLLTENVETLGIVGDVVNVRTGYARNFLLPRGLATTPSEEAIQAVAARRAEAQRMLAEQRKQREALSEKLQGVEVTIQRSCNDQGILYGAVTQQDIATALNEAGHAVKPRDVRLGQTIKRIDTYDVHIKLDTDLDATIKLWVVADRKLDLDRAAEEPEAAASGDAAGAEGGDKAPSGKAGAEPAGKPSREPAAKDKGKPAGKAADAESAAAKKPKDASDQARPAKTKPTKTDAKKG